MSTRSRDATGAVVIGRNEGERLERCLRSLGQEVARIVYVDSGSTDDSVAIASRVGAAILSLDAAQPFTAARARNAGLHRLEEQCPDLEFVQFVDGDCEVQPGWIDRARSHLAAHPDVAVVCGRLRERFPEASIYNRLADAEWHGATGEVAACGGIAMMRSEALRQVGSFDPLMIAGEEPELCCRLRLAGWRVVRLEAEMALHDADLKRFGQWWMRALRGGHAFAEGARLHGRSRLRHNVRQLRSALIWGLGIPTAAGICLLLALVAAGLGANRASGLLAAVGLVLSLGYSVLAVRIYRGRRAAGERSADAALYAVFCVLGKFPEAIGALRFHRSRNRVRQLIEYR